MSDKITCPKCSHKFELTEATAKVLRDQMASEFADRESELRSEFDQEAKRLRKQYAEASQAAQAQAAEVASQAAELRITDLKATVSATQHKLMVAEQQELTLRKAQREVEESKRTLELELTRKLDTERMRIKDEVGASMAEDHRLKQAEWESQRATMEALIGDLKRKAEQGSQQSQGETLELSIEATLREAFPLDEIVPVEKGVSGADLALRVKTRAGAQVGTIIFELKRTKAFSPGWLPKLRDDQRAAKADLAVLVTTAMPDGVAHIGQVDGVWVASVAAYLGLTQALRASLVELAQAKQAQVGRRDKAEVILDYLNGVEFRGRVQAMVESFVSMREGVDAERRAFEKIWSRREKELGRAMTAAAGMWGDLQGLGTSLQAIPQLTLEEVA